MPRPRTSRNDSVDPAPRGARVDFGRFDGSKAQVTPQGGLKVPANLTRTGVLVYRNPDGSTRKEYRPAEEVFKADSLASLEDAPITELHPKEMVSTANHDALAKGHSRGPKEDGKFVAATLIVQAASTVKGVKSGDLQEVSCGYTCREDHTSGTFEGEHYDLIQRDIRYNHVALGPPGWGRAGSEVALRLDSQDASIQARDPEPTSKAPPMKIKIDGKEYEVGTQECFEALARVQGRADAHDAMRTRADAAETKLATEIKRAETAEAQRDQHKQKLDAAADPVKLDELIKSRAALITNAAKILGDEVKLDGKSDLEIKKEVLAKACPKLDLKDRHTDYINARFDAVIEAEPTPLERARIGLSVAKTDGTAPPAPPVPQWKQPHGVHA